VASTREIAEDHPSLPLGSVLRRPASGLAVRFVEPQPVSVPVAPGPTLEQKLTELKTLREKNLITPEEYYDKRSELLKGL